MGSLLNFAVKKPREWRSVLPGLNGIALEAYVTTKRYGKGGIVAGLAEGSEMRPKTN